MEKLYRTLDNINIFKDTQTHCKTDSQLKEAIRETDAKQEFISEIEELDEVKNSREYENSEVIVSKKRTLEAAKEYQGKKVAVLNFADAITPGGAVLYGASTQEEAICRCSTLYESISKDEMLKQFYYSHRKLDSFYNDDTILPSATFLLLQYPL